jgi:hypothetical protein
MSHDVIKNYLVQLRQKLPLRATSFCTGTSAGIWDLERIVCVRVGSRRSRVLRHRALLLRREFVSAVYPSSIAQFP